MSGLLKLFFRELSEPLFPCSYFPQLVNLIRDLENHGGEHSDYFRTFLEDLSMIIASLPKTNQKVLFFLISFLKETSEHQEKNKMTSRNLAVVFAPNIIRPKEDTIETAMLSPQISKLFDLMIENYRTLETYVSTHISKGTVSPTEKMLSPKIKIVSTDKEEPKQKKRTNLTSSSSHHDKRREKPASTSTSATKASSAGTKRREVTHLKTDDKSQLPADLRARATTLTDFINPVATPVIPPSDSEHRISRSPGMKKKVAETPRY